MKQRGDTDPGCLVITAAIVGLILYICTNYHQPPQAKSLYIDSSLSNTVYVTNTNAFRLTCEGEIIRNVTAADSDIIFELKEGIYAIRDKDNRLVAFLFISVKGEPRTEIQK